MQLRNLLVGLAILGIIFAVLEGLWPAIKGQARFRKGLGTDLAYWLFTPLVTSNITRIAVIVVAVIAALLMGAPLAGLKSWYAHRQTLVGQQPIGAQILEMFLLGDLISYWMHRAFHGRRLWKFHAIHHGSPQLDWLSSVRVHPVNELLQRSVEAIPFVILGFRPELVAGYAPFLTSYAILLHANVNWDFGPLRYVIATPFFHRWHHTSEKEGWDKNFAGLFPFIDALFGTLYLPVGKQPTRFGVAGTPVPDGLWAQLVWPFKRAAG